MITAQDKESTSTRTVAPLVSVFSKAEACMHIRKRPLKCVRSQVFSQTLAKALNSMEIPRNRNGEDLRKTDGFVPFNSVLVNELYSSTSHPDTDLSGLKMASDKQGCCVFVRHLPRGVSPQIVVQFLNRMMDRTGLSTSTYKPVVRCRMSGNFAFVDCASMEDANKAIELDGVSFLGSKLRISSSSRYLVRGYNSGVLKGLLERSNMRRSNVKAVNNVSIISDKPTKTLVLGNVVSYEDLDEDEDCVSFLGSKLRISSSSRYLVRGYNSGVLKGSLERSNMRRSNVKAVNNVSIISDKPTKTLVLGNVVSYEDLDEDEDYIETLNDIKDECSRYGSVRKICVPRYGIYATKIFLEYKSIDDAVNAQKKLNNRTFDGRIVAVEFGDVECLDCL
eukprot:CAMPEP_0172521316 /NCGR_PEP_ID=MMETSP1066-20121228/292513_1 /TAXON_ID=671091 /ORGANISM="Coscinodiscus wailesii, Strain CCMP2513" /LENGTH=391 /DNA_ID=CAMNT_0013304215 /DNA_START=54 /DNA_END=1229 /DNA_ORIENTATION=-